MTVKEQLLFLTDKYFQRWFKDCWTAIMQSFCTCVSLDVMNSRVQRQEDQDRLVKALGNRLL